MEDTSAATAPSAVSSACVTGTGCAGCVTCGMSDAQQTQLPTAVWYRFSGCCHRGYRQLPQHQRTHGLDSHAPPNHGELGRAAFRRRSTPLGPNIDLRPLPVGHLLKVAQLEAWLHPFQHAKCRKMCPRLPLFPEWLPVLPNFGLHHKMARTGRVKATLEECGATLEGCNAKSWHATSHAMHHSYTAMRATSRLQHDVLRTASAHASSCVPKAAQQRRAGIARGAPRSAARIDTHAAHTAHNRLPRLDQCYVRVRVGV